MLLGLGDDLIAHAVLVVQPEIGRRRAADASDTDSCWQVLLGQTALLSQDPVGVDHDPRRAGDLLHVHVHRTGHS